MGLYSVGQGFGNPNSIAKGFIQLVKFSVVWSNFFILQDGQISVIHVDTGSDHFSDSVPVDEE